MASWIDIPAVPFNLRDLSHGDSPPLPAYPSIGALTRSRNAHLISASRSPISAPPAFQPTRTRPTTRSSIISSVMAPKDSSKSSSDRRSRTDQSGDGEWMSSTDYDATTETTAIEVFRFMDLPEELRRLMYSYFLSIPPGEEFHLDQSITDWSFLAASAAILTVSKEIYLDAFPVFLRENKFLIGTSLENPHIFRSFGPKRCVYLRALSIQLNDRPVRDSIQILDELSEYCEEIRHLELRMSPGSPFLPYLTSMFVARTQAGASSRANVVLRFKVRKAEALFTSFQAFAIQQDDLARAADDIKRSFTTPFRWPLILQRAHEITIKGCINRSSLDAIENFQHEGWHFAKSVTTPVENCTTSVENVTRKWEPVDRRVVEVDERHPQRWR